MTEIYGAPTLDDALAALAAQVRRAEEAGGSNIIFCEDRLTLLAERAVLAATGGTMRTEVTTFARFLSGSGQVLSKQGSVMALASILALHEQELKCFRKGAAQVVYETVAQLAASRVDAVQLTAAAEETDGMLRLKLRDLAFVFEKYSEFLKNKGLVDENGYLALLPAKMKELGGKNVFFFAFPSFTRQALEGVRAAIEHCPHVTGIFLSGREGAYTNEAAHAFRIIAEEIGEVSARMLKSGLSEEPLALSRGLFSPDIYSREKVQSRHIRIFHAEDEAEEMDVACALIRKHIFEDGLRYRDFAILVPNQESFLNASRALSAHGIPFFSDRKRPFSEHPFSVFTLDILACAHDGCLPDSVDAVLSSVYFGAADNYRNYLLKYGGYRGGVKRPIKESAVGYDLKELGALRDRAQEILGVFPREGTGRTFVQGVRRLYEAVNGDAVTQSLSSHFTGSEQKFLDISPLEGVLQEIEGIAGEERFTAFEFATMLKSGLSSLEIAMIPQFSDVVFVGDVSESKFARVKVLFCLGLDDSLPRTGEDTAVITDGEIGRLKKLSLEIEPAIAVVNARARESLALNVCAFEEALYLGCPRRMGGEEARRGEVIASVLRMYSPAPMPEIFPYDCAEARPAARTLCRLREDEEGGAERDLKKFSSLHEAMLRLGEGKETERLLSGGRKETVPRAGELLLAGEISPTLLEQYFACPYAGFASRGLKLREREERPVLETDTGTFVHTVLERVAVRFNDMAEENEARAAAEETARELLTHPRYAALSDTGAGVYTGSRLVRECGEVTAAAFNQLAGSSFRVRETEGKISLPALHMSGRTDRIDEAGDYVRVIDYKTGNIDDSPLSYYTGQKLQLQLYLLAASEGGKPAGAFYFPAAESYAAEGEVKYRMRGFFNKDDEVLALMDNVRTEGKSAFYEGGGSSEKGLSQSEFSDFLAYAGLVATRAEEEMAAGNITPSPYDGACRWCKFKGMCAFAGQPRKSESVSCSQIAGIVRRARGEEE